MTPDTKLLYVLNGLAGKSPLFDDITIFLAAYSQYFIVAVFILLLSFSAYSRREKLRLFWAVVISIFIARFGVTEAIRFFYHRPRPFVTYYVNQLLSSSSWSFPSGHSAFFFAMATAIWLYNKKWGAWFFIAAILMNISRIITGVHYPSDILGGAAIGIITGFIIFYLFGKLASPSGTSSADT